MSAASAAGGASVMDTVFKEQLDAIEKATRRLTAFESATALAHRAFDHLMKAVFSTDKALAQAGDKMLARAAAFGTALSASATALANVGAPSAMRVFSG